MGPGNSYIWFLAWLISWFLEQKNKQRKNKRQMYENCTLPHLLHWNLPDSGGLKSWNVLVWQGPNRYIYSVRSLAESTGNQHIPAESAESVQTFSAEHIHRTPVESSGITRLWRKPVETSGISGLQQNPVDSSGISGVRWNPPESVGLIVIWFKYNM